MLLSPVLVQALQVFIFWCFRGRVNIFTLLYVDATIELELIPISKVNNCRLFFRTTSSGSSGLF